MNRADSVGNRDSFDIAAFATLAAVEERSFWFQARNRLIVSMLQRHFPHARSLLELGTGTGFVLAAIHGSFPHLHVVGSDLYGEGLDFARQRLPDIELTQIDARSLPFDQDYDVVGAFDVLEHIEEDTIVLEQIRKSLRLGGGTIILVPQHPRLWSARDEAAHHVRRYTRGELVGKVRAAGLEPERVTSFVTSLLPAMWLSRTRMHAEDEPGADLAPGRLNRVFELVLDAERRLVELGLSLPVGGSLLLVARRTA